MATLLYQQLETLIEQEAYEDVLKICHELLSLDKQDVDALRIQLVTLIRLDEYEKALHLLETNIPSVLAREWIFEKAYCLYRLGKLSSVKDLFKMTDTASSAPLTHLRAQIAYKLEDYKQAVQLYTVLVEHTEKSDENYDDLIANLIASQAAALLYRIPLKNLNTSYENTFEQLYNTACIYIAKGQWHKAERLLIRARDECQRSLKEQGYNEEEIEQELIPILAQLAFVYQQQSKHKMAAEYYHMILNTNLAEDTIRSIVLNNTVAQQRPTRKLLPVQSRQLQLAADTKVENKLFMSQRRLLAANRAIMQLGLKKYTVARDMAKRLMVYDPNWSLPFLISAAAPFLQGKRQRTIQELKAALEKNQRLVGVRLALVRLLMDAGQVEEALDRLDDVMVQDLTPDMLMMVASMYETAKQLDRIGSLFNTAISLAQDDVGMMQKILEWRAGYYVRQGQFEDAAKDYEALLKMYPEDPLALAGLVTVYAEMQSDLAARYADALLPPPDISEVRLDVDALEANVPGLGHRYTTRHSAEKKKTPKKIKKRANPPAKNYDPEKEPDPERWLPKRERAGYKPKKRGRAGKMGGSSQGVALSDGGLGGTGSARIEGASVGSPEIKPTKTTSHRKGGKKNKGKGKAKW